MFLFGNVRKTLGFVLLALCALLFFTQTAFCAEATTFHSFYDKSWWDIGIWGWTSIILFTIGATVTTFLTLGKAAPWMLAIGTWIGRGVGLSGIAAANWGLALLGGGSIAAGGFGMLGGSAVLTGAVTFGTSILAEYTTNYAMTQWERQMFAKDSKEMMTLPLPINETGGPAYEETFKQLKKMVKITKKESIESDNNQAALQNCLNTLTNALKNDNKLYESAKNLTLLALLRFQTNDYIGAQEATIKAIEYGHLHEESATLPLFISSVCELYKDNKDTLKSMNDFRDSIQKEEDNCLIPLMYAIYMDRAMYLYHNQQVTLITMRNMLHTTDVPGARNYKAELLSILAMRVMIEAKRTQQDILVLGENKNDDGKYTHEEKQKMAQIRLKTHREMVDFLGEVKEKIQKVEKKIPEDVPISVEVLSKLIEEYREDLPNLAQKADQVGNS